MSLNESLFYVDDSPIHGKGLFARKYIGAGENIGILDGVLGELLFMRQSVFERDHCSVMPMNSF